ncbi:hypothetical protein [Myxacorys almedinensis]|uniref:Uncharacterized protein n=1 Tax=Myxacorys almedinensis A TaxID=2690445 RepID=A0A8J8CGY3_9CYAN|nr:hypothetical protein [Myxacorys almedinensis]NDJ16203.1 hypothetical protein [Myxacorys almedinensis A]
MNWTIVSVKRALALGVSLVVLGGAAAQANTPRGTSGINTGSEIAPTHLTPRFGVPFSLYTKTIGELRAIFTERAAPPNEPGILPEQPGLVKLDLKRLDSTPSSIVSRFTRYVLYLNAQRGQFNVFGSDRRGVSRDVKFALIPKLNRQIEIRFTPKSGSGESSIQTVIAPNIKIAAALVGVLTALDVSGRSPESAKAAIAILTSLGDVNLSNAETLQLAQSLAETLIASDGLIAGCGGQGGSSLTCTDLKIAQLGAAIRAYNAVVSKSSDLVVISLANNAEFQALGADLRRLREVVARNTSR